MRFLVANLLRPGSAEKISSLRVRCLFAILLFGDVHVQIPISDDSIVCCLPLTASKNQHREHLARMTLIHVDIPSSHYVTILSWNRLDWIARFMGILSEERQQQQARD